MGKESQLLWLTVLVESSSILESWKVFSSKGSNDEGSGIDLDFLDGVKAWKAVLKH